MYAQQLVTVSENVAILSFHYCNSGNIKIELLCKNKVIVVDEIFVVMACL